MLPLKPVRDLTCQAGILRRCDINASACSHSGGGSAGLYHGWVRQTPRFSVQIGEDVAAGGLKIAGLVAKSFSGRITSSRVSVPTASQWACS